MNNKPAYNNIDDLLVKYLLHEATVSEQQEVHNWLEWDDKNKQHFNQFALIWKESQKLASGTAMDENAAWDRFLRKTNYKNEAKIVPLRKKRSWPKFLSAAVFAGVVVISLVFFLSQSNRRKMTMISSGNTTLTDSLTDGTIVTLNKNSALIYDKHLSGDTRNVTLKGEAFFNVAPDKNKPFIISINDVTIKVVGTSFNVKNINGNTEVIVESGIVEVKHKSAKISLKAKEKIFVDIAVKKLKKENNDNKLYNYYRTKLFVCDNTPLWQLVKTLNEAYGANIIIKNKTIADLPITTTFNEEPLSKILSVVTTTLNISAEQKNNTIILR